MPDAADSGREPSPERPPPRLSSSTLLQGRREVEITHAGRIYRLRLTASGKLILTG